MGALPSSPPALCSHATPEDFDPPRPSAAEAAENQAHAADPLRLESLELKLSAAAAQRRPRTLRPRRPRTPEIADSAQLGAEQVRGFLTCGVVRALALLSGSTCVLFSSNNSYRL